jgi:hypothetical protein
MRNLVRVGTLEIGTMFVTSLTRRVGRVEPSVGADGVRVSLIREGRLEQRELHPNVLVEVAA